MDSRLKQRLIGAAVLVALAVIFLPMLVQGPAPDSGVSDVPLSMPDPPRAAYETRDLPLVSPGNAPDGGAVGMAPSLAPSPVQPETVAPPAATSPVSESPASPAAALPAASGSASKPDTAGQMFPAPTAGGDYAVSFGTYGTQAAADAIVGSLRASQLPGYREATSTSGKPAWRVRVGPYASQAAAEAARLRAAHVRDDVGARVIALDADSAAKPAATTTHVPTKPPPAEPMTVPMVTPAPSVVPPATPAAAPA
ncbi:MAG: sporulation protein, partial [Xanthomonadaceae bacterium]|nr:sporulation protein [Xanthomonadaceae bacterium]